MHLSNELLSIINHAAQDRDDSLKTSTWVACNRPQIHLKRPSARSVLGISCFYHDAAAAIVRDGVVVAAAEQERFSRKKHDARFPVDAANFCLNSLGLPIDSLDAIAFYEKPLLKFERVLRTAIQREKKCTDYLEKQITAFLNERLPVEAIIRETMQYHGDIHFYDHHLSHAASAFLPSPFRNAAIMTVDGVGEWTTTGQYIGTNRSICPVREIRYPHSLGLLYSTITTFLGFRANTDEYKIMGLAAYGKPRFRQLMNRIVTLHPDGSFSLNLDCFSFMFDDKCMFSETLCNILGPPRVKSEPLTSRHQDIAASLQAIVEDAILGMARAMHAMPGHSGNLCLAGGVALNGVVNRKLLTETPFERVWVQPASGDSGGAIGAALLACENTDSERPLLRFSALLGPHYSNTDIEIILQRNQVAYEWYLEEELLEKTARLIQANQIVGWFQGRMEFGPRALGSRSILANPCDPEMRDILNARVKFREDFRPFAPAILEEVAELYFETPHDSPYMTFVSPVRAEKRQIIPSVTHVDGSARVQTVRHADNPRFYRLLQAVERRSGVPMVINTSFNIQGEPIVCSPQDAVNCFLKTDIDALVIGSFIVVKQE
jgi:carbamoyltransferase